MNDHIRLTEIEDPKELNNQVFQVTCVINSHKFKINANTVQLDRYTRGGIFRKIKKKLEMHFESLETELDRPTIVMADLSAQKFANPQLVHALLKTYLRRSDWNDDQIDEFVGQVRKVTSEDVEHLARVFFLTRRSEFPPLSAFFGGVCAQEALKAITSKFVPIKQWLYLDYAELFEVKCFDNFNVKGS